MTAFWVFFGLIYPALNPSTASNYASRETADPLVDPYVPARFHYIMIPSQNQIVNTILLHSVEM